MLALALLVFQRIEKIACSFFYLRTIGHLEAGFVRARFSSAAEMCAPLITRPVRLAAFITNLGITSEMMRDTDWDCAVWVGGISVLLRDLLDDCSRMLGPIDAV